METEGDRGFRNRWELPAPESYALLYGPKDARQIFKLALLELVARGYLELAEIEEPGRFGRSRKTTVLRHGTNRGRPESRSLGAVLSLFTGAVARPVGGRQTEMPVPDLARSARTHYGSFEGYVEAQVMPALQRRNLFERRMRRRLGIFQTLRWEPTHSGEAARAELLGSMALGEERFAGWVDLEPSQALRFLGLAGSSVLLMSPLHPDVRRLRETPEARRSRDDWIAAGYVPVAGAAADDPGGERPGDGGDPGGLDLDTLSLDFGALGGLGDASSAIDSGVDSSGGGFWDGGGWSGDGGGGGGWGGDGGGGFGGGGDGGGGGGGS